MTGPQHDHSPGEGASAPNLGYSALHTLDYNSPKWQCDTCGEKFVRETGVQDHLRRTHSVPQSVAPQSIRVVVIDDTNAIRLRGSYNSEVVFERIMSPNDCMHLAHTLIGCALWRMDG